MCEKGKKLIKQKAFQTDFQINISVWDDKSRPLI
jgi:hypothetical protein